MDSKEDTGGSMETLRGCLGQSALRHGPRPAIRFFRNGTLETEMTYEGLDRDAGRLAGYLHSRGVAKGDRVLLILPKCLFFVTTHLALQKLGAVSLPLNPGFKRSEVAYFVKDAEPVLAVAGLEQEPLVRETAPGVPVLSVDAQSPYQELPLLKEGAPLEELPELSEEDPALIIYTSGTTGKPKGAILTHRNLVHDAMKVQKAWEITDRDVLCHALPLFHVHGLCFALHTCLMAGAKTLMLDAFDPQTVIQILSQGEGPDACTLFMAVPSMYAKLLELLEGEDLDFSHVRLWTSGSAPLLPRDFHKIREILGQEPVEREGMSETGMNFSNPLHGPRKPGSIGLPLPGLEVRIVDPETLEDLPSGKTGEIWLRGPGITPGYWRKPRETEEAFHEGWFRTGDLGHVDEDGYYYLTDRIKHIIISGGENISPKEVESVINRLEEVVESSVVGVEDPKWGEKVVAAVVIKPGSQLNASEIKRHCKTELHDWKCPKEVVFLKELPKNTMGKVLKEEVKKCFI